MGLRHRPESPQRQEQHRHRAAGDRLRSLLHAVRDAGESGGLLWRAQGPPPVDGIAARRASGGHGGRSEEHTSALQSLMRISYAVFCLKKKKYTILTASSERM